MAEHSDIGASAIPRLIKCPASFLLTQALRRAGRYTRRSSVWAATGTVAHALAEEAITTGKDPSVELGETVTVDEHEITVDADMVAGVQTYVGFVAERSEGATETLTEFRVCLDPYWPEGAPPPVSAFGTLDFAAYHVMTRHLDLIDYKNGGGVFVPEDSDQLLYYAAGALREIEQRGHPYPLTVDLSVVQPNVPRRQKVRTHRTTALDVLIWVQDVLIPTIAEASQPGARISIGEHCRFCPVGQAAACPAKHALAQDMARRDFGPSEDGIAEWTPDLLAEQLNDFALIEDHIEAVKALALDLATSGTRIPGYAVVPTRAQRSFTAGVEVLSRVLKAAGHDNIPHALMTEPALRSPAQVEKLLTPEAWALLADYVQSKSSGTKLVPSTNPDTGNFSARATPQDDFA